MHRRRKSIISIGLNRVHHPTIFLINAASKSRVSQSVAILWLVLDEKEHKTMVLSLSFLLFLPDKNFSSRIKDGGPWSSLNFKLKNTVGYRVIGKFPPRSPGNFYLRGMFCATRQKSDFKIFCIQATTYACIGFRALNIGLTIIIIHKVSSCRGIR